MSDQTQTQSETIHIKGERVTAVAPKTIKIVTKLKVIGVPICPIAFKLVAWSKCITHPRIDTNRLNDIKGKLNNIISDPDTYSVRIRHAAYLLRNEIE